MIVGIVCQVEVLKLNYEAIVWQVILPDYLAGVCHRLAAVFIRTSDKIFCRGSGAEGRMSRVEGKENDIEFFCGRVKQTVFLSEPHLAHTKSLNPYGINVKSVRNQRYIKLSRSASFGRVCSLLSITSGPFRNTSI